MDFEQIYSEHFKTVYLYILSLCKNKDVAAELTQDTFFKALKSIKKFRGDCDINVWLCQIAKNTCYTYFKKTKKTISTETQTVKSDFVFEEVIEDKFQAKDLHAILHNLGEPYKEVFSLRVFAELSFKSIAEIFGKTDNWACVTFHRAKAMILKEMRDN